MSTKALIARELASGKYKTVYCHSDGYPDYVGKLLLTQYNTVEKLDELQSLGDISALGEKLTPNPTKPHDHLHMQQGVTLAYCRDIGEELIPPREYTYSQLMKYQDIDYIYILGQEGDWRFTHARAQRSEWKNLADELKCEPAEEAVEAEGPMQSM